MTPVRRSTAGTLVVRDQSWGGEQAPWRVIYVPSGVMEDYVHGVLSDQAVQSWDLLLPRREVLS